MEPITPLPLPELVALAAVPAALDEYVGALRVPLIAVDVGRLSESLAPGGGMPTALATVPAVIASVGPLAGNECVDVHVDGADALATLAVAVEQSPLAAVALALLLRGGDRRRIADGLIAESAVYSMLQAGPEFMHWRATHEIGRHADSEPVVLTERDATTLTITLNRPSVHNAYSVAMRDGLTDALHTALADPSITHVTLRGAGPSFCSGGDLDEFGSFPDPATAHTVRIGRSAGRLLALLSRSVTVFVHGSCLGAGIELSAFAGTVVAHPDTVIKLPEVAMGLVPGAGGTVSLPRRIGRHRTAWLALTGAQLDAATALAWGLVDDVRSSLQATA